MGRQQYLIGIIGQNLSDKIFMASAETSRNVQKHFQVRRLPSSSPVTLSGLLTQEVQVLSPDRVFFSKIHDNFFKLFEIRHFIFLCL